MVQELDSGNVDELSALLAIAAEGSFVGAARVIRRHPTIISKRIASLERRLGVRLLERTTRRVRLSEIGQRLVDRVRDATAMIAEAERDASADAAELRGRLRLSFPAAMGRAWLAPALPAFLARYPRLQVEVDYSERYVDLVAEGFDAAIRLGALEDSRLIARKLAEHRLVLGCSPAYLERFGAPASPRDLAAHNVLEYSGPVSASEWRLSSGGRREAVTPAGSFRTNDIATMLDAALGGIGIVCAGEWLLARSFASGALIQLLPDWRFELDGGVHVVRASTQFAPTRTQAFVTWIETLFVEGAPWDRAAVERSGPV